ncbi:MAG: DUF4347 domain-containing protein, partial [Mycobacterium sp.]|nr:DUF4347 domain-containing protein [Mycobacterium sp.]
CDVSAAGAGFLEALKTATGRDVAGSTDATGATALGGNWTLEASTGVTPVALPADLAALQSFDGLLLSGLLALENSSAVKITSTATDSSGNIYVAGVFNGSVDFGGTSKTSTGGAQGDIFMAEYTSTGTLKWVDDLVRTAEYSVYTDAPSIAVTPNGSTIYLGGSFETKINFDGSHSASGGNGGTTENNAAFVAQYLNSGTGTTFEWDFLIAGASGTVAGAQLPVVTTDSSSNVFAAVQYYTGNGTVHLTPQSGATTVSGSAVSLASSLYDGSVIFEASSSGSIDWHATITNQTYINSNGDVTSYTNTVAAIALDSSDNVYVGGTINGAVFNGNNGTSVTVSTPTSTSQYAAFIAKLNSSGNFQWENAVATTTGTSWPIDSVTGIAIDQYGPAITGTYNDGTTIDGTLLHTKVSYSYSSTRVFVEQLDTSGTAKWVLTESDNTRYATDQSSAIVIDAAGDIVVGGTINSSSSATEYFGGTTISPPGSNQTEAFVWDITPGASSATTNSIEGFTSSSSNSLGGLFAPTSGGAGMAINGSGVITAHGSTGTAIEGTSGKNTAALFGLTSTDLNEVTAPTVTSITRDPAHNATNHDATETFDVTFSESVTQVDASDFTLVRSNNVSGTISSVTGSGTTYTVTV